MKKICFAILVHEKKMIIKDMINNIKYFCPNSLIVLYNGGNDPHLCDGLGYPVCPTSKKIQWGNLAPYILDVMKWLNDTGYKYHYLINLDSDALFMKKGFEEFVISEMKNTDYMGIRAKIYTDKWRPGRQMKKKWSQWQPIFNLDEFWGCFNVGQIFSKKLVKQILSFDKLNELEKNIYKNATFALEEILYVTMTKVLGFKVKSYPKEVSDCIRAQPHFTILEVKDYLRKHSRCYLIHPIRRDINNETRRYIRSLITPSKKSKKSYKFSTHLLK